MAYNLALIVAVLVSWTWSHPQEYTNSYIKEYSRNITLKQGTLQGIVVGSRLNRRLPFAEQYRGIPFASPPVGGLRFMYPGSAPSWFGTKFADSFGPVCPQKFPDERTMAPERREEFLRLKEYLLNQSEDCLYLNVYAPYQGNRRSSRKYPVIVFIHGESFEWNSGNPYDGSVLAAHGNVVVVTLNYRLGVLGFLKAGIEEHSQSNFGLVDQVAALVWVKANIAAFGGDPNTITLLGHGTGAVCASLLMLSPMISQEGNKTLFQRAILMGGTALSDWALAGNPREVTHQVASALNCQIDDDFVACLRRKRLDEIMAAGAVTSPYRSLFGPVVDSVVVPNEPRKSMSKYTDIFRRFELMYGVSELESVHLLSPDALKFGMLEKERDQELRKYLRLRCEMRAELCVTRTLEEYSGTGFGLEDNPFGYTGHEPDRASLARDALLDILSDGRTVAPMVQMAKYHASLNLQSYFYVFTHRTQSRGYLREKTRTGEALPYVFGVPLGGAKFHFTGTYSDQEKLFSEVVMAYFCNFAYTGDPNMPRKNDFYSLQQNDWNIYTKVDWPEFNLKEQKYLQLGIPPHVQNNYREDKIKFWNEVFPDISLNRTYPPPLHKKPTLKKPPPAILSFPPRKSTVIDKYENFNKPFPTDDPTYGRVRLNNFNQPNNILDKDIVYGTVINSPDAQPSTANLTTVTIVMGTIFIVSNLLLFLSLYLRRYRKRKLQNVTMAMKTNEPGPANPTDAPKTLPNGCNLINFVKTSTRSEDTYEAVSKLPRQMSSSTIDAHTKVRDWITSEIVYKYSPRFLRRHRPPLLKSASHPVPKPKPEKVSVAVDATPSGRGNSVLAQLPIEATTLRRSLTLEDFSTITPESKAEMRKSTTSINFKLSDPTPTVVRIEHSHSKSEPVQDLYSYCKKMRSFDPNSDVNVTSLDGDEKPKTALTPEEALLTIKRRNFPKVLPDYPSREALAKKRRSMPASHHAFQPIFEIPQDGVEPKSFSRLPPPTPPTRTTSSLSRKPAEVVCQSAPMLAQEPPASPEPEVACNSFYFGPLVPKLSASESSKLDNQPIYERLRPKAREEAARAPAKTIVTADPAQPLKKVDAKVIIRPTMARSGSDPRKNVARVVAADNFPDVAKKPRPSMIPTLVKGKESSSESSPSEESDTGTVVKKA